MVRSSALVEDRAGATFAGQFESFLGLDNEADFLTSVRACWAALWSTNARRYMANHGLDPAATAMAVLIQPLIAARASGGGMSRTAEGNMLLSATWGLGSAIAQGEVVPDRVVLSRQGFVRTIEPGRKDRSVGVALGTATDAIKNISKQILPPTVTTQFQGSAKVFQQSLSNFGLLLFIAISALLARVLRPAHQSAKQTV